MDVPDGLRYTDDHEWLRLEGEEGTIGITAYAADQLGDVVFVELPAVGTQLEAGKTLGVVESVKAVSDLYAPLAGEVVAVNEALADHPELVNSAPYGEGWMLRLRLAEAVAADGLKDAAAYRELIAAA
ncbi:MAG TPA: glycine cleavage system protein GcvH [Candidatus Limnocylindrales bacterium]|nr:glycine cleavage system protein GcvH [Candidatus Limnocylindrales bacterium]